MKQHDMRGNLRFADTHDISWTWDGRVKTEFGENLPKIYSGIILDAGCSYGSTTRELARLYPGCKVIGIDINSDTVRAASREKMFGIKEPEVESRVWFKTADLYLLEKSFPPRTFEAIFCMNNWIKIEYDLSLEENIMIGQGLGKRLKENGFLCISGQSEKGPDFGLAIFQKENGRLKPRIVNDGFRCLDSFDYMARAFGLPAWHRTRT